jgi:O-antigen ligase
VAEIAAAVLVCVVICFGGASQLNAAALAMAELLSVPVFALALWRTARSRPQGQRLPLAILAALFLVPVVQLIPLPPAIWTHLPGRSGVVQIYRAAQIAPPPLPLSLTAEATIHCVLALIPPAALFLIVRTLDLASRVRVTLALLALALVSLMLAALQIAHGPESALRFYRNTHVSPPVGFFGNYDHLADLFACALPMAMAGVLGLDHGRARRSAWAPRALLLVIPLLIMGIAVTGSRAGVILGAVGLGAGIGLSGLGPRRAGLLGLGLILAAGGLVILAALTDRLPALARFAEKGPDLRFTTIPDIVSAIRSYWPLGSGVGSFIPIYQTVQPTALVDPTFLNHAHDEYLEATLESGVAAWVIFAAFAVWWVRRGLAAWRHGAGPATRLAKAGAVVVGMILLHATVDFPFRNVALASVFALACALLTPPPTPDGRSDSAAKPGRRRPTAEKALSSRRAAPLS